LDASARAKVAGTVVTRAERTAGAGRGYALLRLRMDRMEGLAHPSLLPMVG